MNILNIPVEEFTTPDPITANESSSIEELFQLMNKNGIRHIPILKGTTVVGIVSERDLNLVRDLEFKEKSILNATNIMAKNPVSVSSQDTIEEVAFEMSKRKIGSVIVNEGDKLLGIFTVTDALNALIELSRARQ